MTNAAINANLPQEMIDPTTFSVKVYLQIACHDEDQILSRPVGDGYTYMDLIGTRVQFSGNDQDIGAIPASVSAVDVLNPTDYGCSGYCECVELALTAQTFGGESISLGTYGGEHAVEEAKAAIALPINMILAGLQANSAQACALSN